MNKSMKFRYWKEIDSKDVRRSQRKAGTVVSDVIGVFAREMLNAIADGEEDPEKLADFTRRTMKKKKEEL
ncbi:hypothetical protein [Bacillus sp. M6-12]|uniref:hypothetical protein n=1 Tax=Bacillus sp. M6-12 TaxID=2054166 RepID=UPI0015E13D07|nr:hypothetical protein [Bacillus sp. M6-12]